LAKSSQFLLPELNESESLESLSIHSLAGQLSNSKKLITTPPFRSPHTSISAAALLGGGPNCNPGEVSLSHRGILFLDEFSELPVNLIDSLRHPMETGDIFLSRVRYSVNYPSNFILIAAMNPYKCGYYSSAFKKCICSIKEVKNYQQKISGPIKQRFVLWVFVDIQDNFLDKMNNEHETNEWITLSQNAIKTASNRFESMSLL
jgi:magnesium chelatase family protein